MKTYLLTNFILLHFKSLGYRKLANIQKFMQIRMPFVQTNIFFFFLPICFGKMASPQTVKCSISICLHYLTQPTVQWHEVSVLCRGTSKAETLKEIICETVPLGLARQKRVVY